MAHALSRAVMCHTGMAVETCLKQICIHRAVTPFVG